MTEPLCQTIQCVVDAALAGQRLDKLLPSLAPDLSRAQAKAMIEAGAVKVNGSPCHVPRTLVKEEDEISFDFEKPEEAPLKAEKIPLDILYEDEHVLVVNKPAGLTVHPGAGVSEGTLVNALLAHAGGALSSKGGEDRPGIVHRLDKETSGVMVVAKTDLAYDSLTAQFADHGRSGPLKRAYVALVWGRPFPLTGQIDAPIGRSTKSRVKMAVVQDGRLAVTNYALIGSYFPAETLEISEVECQLETGRTHQIRVHFAHIKCPVVGDPVYGTGFITKAKGLSEGQKQALDALGRQALHARDLTFSHPVTDEEMAFSVEPPEDYTAFKNSLSLEEK